MPASPEQPVVSLRQVSHFFGQGELRKQILFDVTADVLPGELVMVMGPSGSGKTTLLNLIAALRSVSHGSLQVLGRELRGASSATMSAVRRRIGFIFQHHHLMDSLNTRENVQMGIGIAGWSRARMRSSADQVLAEVGLSDKKDSPVSALSGGQRQRVAVARALVRAPELLLADEPTSALDRQAGHEIMDLLRTLARKQGCGVIVVTHDNRILDMADRLMYLEDGRLTSFATVTSPHAAHLLTALRTTAASSGLPVLMRSLPERDFLEMLGALKAESEQLLNVLELGDPRSVHQIFADSATAALERAVSITGAKAAHIWTSGTRPQCVLSYPERETGDPPAAVSECFATHATTHAASSLCIPLFNREYEIHAAVELRGPALGTAAERQLRDFMPPLGLLTQAYCRLETHA